MRTRKDILLIFLGLLLTVLISFIPNTISQNWDLPMWEIISIVLADLIALAVLIFLIRHILKELREIDTKEKAEQKKRETRLINTIVKSLKDEQK